MNRILVFLAASTWGLTCVCACSGDSTPSSGSSGGSGGVPPGGSAGSAGLAGGPAQGGAPPTGGGPAQGGAPPPGGGSNGGGAGGRPEGGAAGAKGELVEAVLGRRCVLTSTIGVVEVTGFPGPYVNVTLFDRPDPWVVEPELVNETCAYHHYTPGACRGCATDEVCSSTSECVPAPRSVKDARLVVSTASERREYQANVQLGGLSAPLDIGNESSLYSMTLGWGDTLVTLPPMPVGDRDLPGLQVRTEGDALAPGALDVTWQPSRRGSYVRSRIPINHHAAGPTFTDCGAPESAGALHADAEMVDPLAVQTGLEFQGVEHVYVAAAETEAGCVEFRFGSRILVLPN